MPSSLTLWFNSLESARHQDRLPDCTEVLEDSARAVAKSESGVLDPDTYNTRKSDKHNQRRSELHASLS